MKKQNNIVSIVYKKECKSILKDRRMILSLLAPLGIIPIVIVLIGLIASSFLFQTKTIGTNEPNNPIIQEIQKENPTIQIIKTQDFQNEIKNGNILIGIEIPNTFDTNVKNYQPLQFKIYSESSNSASQSIIASANDSVEKFNQKILTTFFQEKNLPHAQNLISISSATINIDGQIQDSDAENFSMLGSIISYFPMLLMLGSFSGLIPVVTEMGAAEKERNSFETLLSTQASRTQIILGKLLTTVTFSMLSSFIFILAISIFTIPLIIYIPQLLISIKDFIQPLPWILTMIMLFLVAIFFSSITLIISLYARSFKEAQTYLSYITFLLIVPSYATMFNNIRQVPHWQVFTPLLSQIVVMKQLLSGIIIWQNVLLSFGVIILAIIVSIKIMVKLLNNENFIFR